MRHSICFPSRRASTSPTSHRTRRCLETDGCGRPSSSTISANRPLAKREHHENVAAARLGNRVEGVGCRRGARHECIIFLLRNMSSSTFRSAYDPGYLSTMKYLCLIHLNEGELAAMPARDASELNARHLDFNDGLRETGNFIVAEALAPAQETTRVTTRGGRSTSPMVRLPRRKK